MFSQIFLQGVFHSASHNDDKYIFLFPNQFRSAPSSCIIHELLINVQNITALDGVAFINKLFAHG